MEKNSLPDHQDLASDNIFSVEDFVWVGKSAQCKRTTGSLPSSACIAGRVFLMAQGHAVLQHRQIDADVQQRTRTCMIWGICWPRKIQTPLRRAAATSAAAEHAGCTVSSQHAVKASVSCTGAKRSAQSMTSGEGQRLGRWSLGPHVMGKVPAFSSFRMAMTPKAYLRT